MSKINVRDRNKNNPDRKPNWEYRFETARVDGKRQSVSKSGFSTKKEALIAGTEALAQYNNAGLHFEPKEISVSDYLDYWMKEVCLIEYKYNTQKGYSQIISNHLKPKFGYLKLKSITPAILQEFLNELVLQGYSRSSYTNILCAFSSALNYAVEPLKFIKTNPMKYVKFPKKEYNKENNKTLDNETFQNIISRFPFGNRFHIPLMLGWYCGLRISEAFALTWDDVDFDNNQITINKQIIRRKFDNKNAVAEKMKLKDEKNGWYFSAPKYNSYRTIKVSPNIIELLAREKKQQECNEEQYGEFYTIHVQKEELDEKNKPIIRIIPVIKSIGSVLPRANMVCISENGEYTSTDSFKYAAKVIHYELNIDFHYHMLRHSHATTLIANGASPKLVQQRLGHQTIQTTLQTYVHVTEEMQEQAVQIFDMAQEKCPPVKNMVDKRWTLSSLVNKIFNNNLDKVS